MERQMVSRMMPRFLVWAQGNCDVTPERGRNGGRAVFVGGPCLLGDSREMSEELGAGMGYLLGILALWLRMQLCKEEVRGEKTKKAMTALSVCLPKTPEWKLLEKMRKTRDWGHGNPKRAVSREREQLNMPRFLDSKWGGATNYHCGLEVAVEGAAETESLQGEKVELVGRVRFKLNSGSDK